MIPGRPDHPRYTLPAQRRIRRKLDFLTIKTGGQRFGNALFGITMRGNEAGGPRLGLAVSVKVAGSGVERNRIRRAIRESFRLNQHELPAADLVVSARSGARGTPSGELRASLQALWSEAIKRCATLQKL